MMILDRSCIGTYLPRDWGLGVGVGVDLWMDRAVRWVFRVFRFLEYRV